MLILRISAVLTKYSVSDCLKKYLILY